MAQPSTKSIKVNRLGLIVPHYDYCYIIVITGIVTVFKVMVILKKYYDKSNDMQCCKSFCCGGFFMVLNREYH